MKKIFAFGPALWGNLFISRIDQRICNPAPLFKRETHAVFTADRSVFPDQTADKVSAYKLKAGKTDKSLQT
jgi:hypothetical protein